MRNVEKFQVTSVFERTSEDLRFDYIRTQHYLKPSNIYTLYYNIKYFDFTSLILGTLRHLTVVEIKLLKIRCYDATLICTKS